MPPTSRIPVIIDTDPGVDDVLAILLALASPELEILAIIVSFGNTDANASYANVLKLYKAIETHIRNFPGDAARFPNFKQGNKPILAMGEDHPLAGEIHSAQYFHGRDGLAGISERHPDLGVDNGRPEDHEQLQITDKAGVELVLDLLKSHPSQSITYIALGPLTNLAKATRLDRATVKERIGRIVCMGGALDVPGNTSPVAEFNFFADPYAVHELLCPSEPTQSLPLDRFLLLPLDITTPHELPFPIYAARIDNTFRDTSAPSRAADKPPLVHFTSAFLERTREVMCEFGKDAMELHDIAAVWCALANPSHPPRSPAGGDRQESRSTRPPLQEGWKAMRRKFAIERTGELTRGMLVVDRRDDPGAYAPGANRSEVQAELERARFAQTHPGALIESAALPARVEVELATKTAGGDAAAVHEGDAEGVWCVTETPGSAALVRLLFERVWGVRDED